MGSPSPLPSRQAPDVASAWLLAAAIEHGRFLFTRPCYGGKAREVVSFKAAAALQVPQNVLQTRSSGRGGLV